MKANARYDYISREVLGVFAERFVGAHDLRNPLANAQHADLRGLPPMLVLAGGAEVLLDDARALAARARAAGVDVTLEIEPDMVHAWVVFGMFERSKASIERIGRFVAEHQQLAGAAVRRARKRPSFAGVAAGCTLSPAFERRRVRVWRYRGRGRLCAVTPDRSFGNKDRSFVGPDSLLGHRAPIGMDPTGKRWRGDDER